MATCRICLHEYKRLKYRSARIAICGRCVNALNEYPQVAQEAESRVMQLLASGMRRNAELDQAAPEHWKRKRAQWIIDHFDTEVRRALPSWLNRLLADPKNTRKDFKILRACRRGLLHYDRPRDWGYPSKWGEVASAVRKRDGFECVACGANNCVLDVHHLIYVSHFGTHQSANLVTLCRKCHESEHGRVLDFGELPSDEHHCNAPGHQGSRV